jgi:hypothetical protein
LRVSVLSACEVAAAFAIKWTLLRTVAEGLEWSYGGQPAAAQRLRFVLDFAYATGLRASELVHATLCAIEVDHEERWLHFVGKGSRAGRLTLPPLARSALDRYFVQRGLPTTPHKWDLHTPLVGKIAGDAGINRARLWVVMCADLFSATVPGSRLRIRQRRPFVLSRGSFCYCHGCLPLYRKQNDHEPQNFGRPVERAPDTCTPTQ